LISAFFFIRGREKKKFMLKNFLDWTISYFLSYVLVSDALSTSPVNHPQQQTGLTTGDANNENNNIGEGSTTMTTKKDHLVGENEKNKPSAMTSNQHDLIPEKSILTLINLFSVSRERAIEALEKCGGNVQKAGNLLLEEEDDD
jgi:hypothetical protein